MFVSVWELFEEVNESREYVAYDKILQGEKLMRRKTHSLRLAKTAKRNRIGCRVWFEILLWILDDDFYSNTIKSVDRCFGR